MILESCLDKLMMKKSELQVSACHETVMALRIDIGKAEHGLDRHGKISQAAKQYENYVAGVCWKCAAYCGACLADQRCCMCTAIYFCLQNGVDASGPICLFAPYTRYVGD